MKELVIGTYTIPVDCRAVVRNGQFVEVTKRKNRCLGPNEYRCKDCKHRIKGHTLINSYWETDVCEKKPKVVKNASVKHQLFYSANPYGKPCEYFELK